MFEGVDLLASYLPTSCDLHHRRGCRLSSKQARWAVRINDGYEIYTCGLTFPATPCVPAESLITFSSRLNSPPNWSFGTEWFVVTCKSTDIACSYHLRRWEEVRPEGKYESIASVWRSRQHLQERNDPTTAHVECTEKWETASRSTTTQSQQHHHHYSTQISINHK